MKTIKPKRDLVLLQVLKPEKTESGIVLPDTAENKSDRAKVVEVGPDVLDVKKGDKVLFEKYEPIEIEIDKKEFLMCKEEKLLAKIQ